MELLLVVAALIFLGLAALRWGVDSTDRPSSYRWSLRSPRWWP
jgi:hypothetical protein